MAIGTVEIVEDNAVKIDGVFYHVGGNVKVEFLRPGKCEYSVEDDGETVTFVKMDKSAPTQRTFGKNKPKPKTDSNDSAQFRDPAEIIREGCLNAAVKVVIAENRDTTCENVIKAAKKFEKYVTDNEAKPE